MTEQASYSSFAPGATVPMHHGLSPGADMSDNLSLTMRIGFVLNQFPELSETFVLNQVVGLMRRGHEVEVLAGQGGFGVDLSQSELTTGERQRLERATTFSHMPGRLAVRSARSALRAPFWWSGRRGVVLQCFDPRRFGWFAVSGTIYSMAEPLLARPRHYDAVIAHFGPQGIIADGLRELGLLSGPLLTFFHAYDLTSLPRLVGSSMYRRLFSRGERLVAISQRGRRLLEGLGAPSERVLVHHMGIDVERFATRPKPRSKRPLRLLSVGRLTEKKGFAVALKALSRVRDRSRFDYRIVGEGRERRRLERLIHELDLGSRVTLLGACSQADVRAELAHADVFIAPSITAKNGDEEGIPMVIMEALACQLAVIATRHGGIPEVVEQDVTGLLAEEGDARGLADALDRVADDEAFAGALGRAGRHRVEREFSLSRQLDQLEGLLDDSRSEA